MKYLQSLERNWRIYQGVEMIPLDVYVDHKTLVFPGFVFL